MDHIPADVLFTIFKQFLPPLVTDYDTAAASDMPLEEETELSKNLVSCNLVCRRWGEIIKENPSLFSRDAHYITDSGLASRDCLRAKGDYVKRLVVGEDRKVGSTSNRFLAFFPNVVHVTWACGITWDEYYLGRKAAYPPLKNLTRLDWKLCGNLKTSVRSFIKLVRNSPILEYITVTEDETSLTGVSGWRVKFVIPDSVTTLRLFFRRSKRDLGRWVGSRWFTRPATSLKHVITSGSFRRPNFNFSIIELQPDPCSITKLVEPDLQNFLPKFLQKFFQGRLPRGGSTGDTLIYSITSYPPPVSYDRRAARYLDNWVHKLVLKTSGSSRCTEDEKWNAVDRHLDYVFKQFRMVRSIDLCGDFLSWKEDDARGKEILERFEKSAKGFSMAVRYINQIY